MRKMFLLAVIAAALPLGAHAMSCSAHAACFIGERLTVFTSPSAPAAACPTQALSAYVNFIYGAAAVTGTLGRPMPTNFTKVEARFKGNMVSTAKSLREASGVASIKEGVAACQLAKKGAQVVLVSRSADGIIAKVAPLRGGTPFWIPAAMLDKKS